jgi:signal transduction histidine kinase
MLGEILVGALVVAVAILVAVDISRTKNDSPGDHADGSAHDVRPGIAADLRRGRLDAFGDSAGTPMAAAGRDAESARRPESTPPAGSRPRAGLPTATKGSRRALKDWPVRSRLQLLVIIATVAVGVAAFCLVRLVDALQGTAIHSSTSSVHDRAIASVLVAGIVLVVVLALALWLAVVTAKSVLKPLYELRAGALGVAADVRLLEEIRNENNGEGVPSNLAPIAVDSADEIGDVSRAVNEMRSEVLRLAANEGALRGKLDAMFVNLSHRSQSLVERQIRLIENLEQGEQDRERRAGLFRMNRIASRMHRSSQNLLILAGHVPSSDWNQQPITLVNLIRAAVSEIEEYERISLSALPDVAVRGPAVNDVVHLLAELAENAASFSAADMLVDISSHPVTSGGVLIDITDRGVGMAEKELAYANWRLENPPAADINIPKWMGLFVVAKLAERHGIRVRLRQAEFGGLTALVWLPDDILTHQGAAITPRRGSHSSAGSGPSLREAAVDAVHATAEPQLAAARSADFASARDEVRDASLSRPFIPDTGRRLGSPLPPVSRPQPVSQAEVPAGVRVSGSGRGQEARLFGGDPGAEISAGTFDTRPATALSEPEGTSQFASSPVGTVAPPSREANPAESGVIVPPAEVHPESRRLPIYDAVESNWFRGGREPVSSPGRAAASPNRWSSPADAGWHAAEAADSPSSDGSTGAGLPKRLPNTNLIPGTIPSADTVAPVRSAIAARDRLARLQRGVSEGRAAASEARSPGGEDDS